MIQFEYWWLLVIPFFFALGWIAARVDIKQLMKESTSLPATYFKGLNYLITNQYEKAVNAFMDAVRINNESLELHFALGSILRRIGHIDRAINMHLDLLENRDLNPSQEESVKAELAQDYLKAGLFDRAEELFLKLESGKYKQYASNALLEIYVKEREWHNAIKMATKLEKESGVSFRLQISHYHCEIALNAILDKDKKSAIKSLHDALDAHKKCVRANILLGDLDAEDGDHNKAINHWKKIEFQDPESLGLVAAKILNSFEKLKKPEEGLSLLNLYFENYKLRSLLNVIYEATLKLEGSEMAEELARKELIRKPSLQALDQLFQARALNSKHKEQDIQLIQQTVRNAIGNRRLFTCSSCGFKAKQHHWQCPACNAWEALPSEPTEMNEIS